MPTLHLSQDADADRLLSENPFALLVGMLLDQQIQMELAFLAPYRLAERLGTSLTPEAVVAREPDELEAVFRTKPALHRYPGAMAKRVRALAEHLLAEHQGDAAAVWSSTDDGDEVRRRLAGLPGFGPQKAAIFTALLGKQCGLEATGWREAAGEYGQEGYRSVADVTGPESLAEVRAFKQARKAAAKASG